MKRNTVSYPRLMLVLAVCILVAIGCYPLIRSSRQSPAPDQFIVGMSSGYAPYVSTNAQGDYEGFDIDVAHALADSMGKQLVLEDLGSMPALFIALDQGRIDAIIWGLEMTKERMEKVAMLHYYGEPTRSYPLVFWKNPSMKISSLADMKGKTVCVEAGSSQDAVLSKHTDIIRFAVEKVDDALLNIQYGKADAALIDPTLAKKFKRIYSDIQIVELPLDAQEQVQGIGIAVKANNNQLIDQLKKAVTQIKDANTIAQFEHKWAMS